MSVYDKFGEELMSYGNWDDVDLKGAIQRVEDLTTTWDFLKKKDEHIADSKHHKTVNQVMTHAWNAYLSGQKLKVLSVARR